MQIETNCPAGCGGELLLNQMPESSRREIGRKTMAFINSIRRNDPELWEEIRRKAKEMEGDNKNELHKK